MIKQAWEWKPASEFQTAYAGIVAVLAYRCEIGGVHVLGDSSVIDVDTTVTEIEYHVWRDSPYLIASYAPPKPGWLISALGTPQK